MEFLLLFQMFHKYINLKPKSCHNTLQSEYTSLEKYLQNIGQQRAKVEGQKEWEATAIQEWASPTLPGGLQTRSQ